MGEYAGEEFALEIIGHGLLVDPTATFKCKKCANSGSSCAEYEGIVKNLKKPKRMRRGKAQADT